jgi:hypothetical protein
VLFKNAIIILVTKVQITAMMAGFLNNDEILDSILIAVELRYRFYITSNLQIKIYNPSMYKLCSVKNLFLVVYFT